MTSDDPIQTQSHLDPIPAPKPGGSSRSSGGGHWYSFPGAPAAMPVSEAELRRSRRGRRVRDRVERRKVRRELGAPDEWAWVIIASALLGITIISSMIVFFLLQATRGAEGTVATSAPPVEPTSVL